LSLLSTLKRQPYVQPPVSSARSAISCLLHSPLTPPPTLPLFPYTTLFRSVVARSPSGQAVAYPVVESVQRDGICHEVTAPAPRLDRKSTRLNSSHVKISYAVFCLKKKNQARQYGCYELADSERRPKRRSKW